MEENEEILNQYREAWKAWRAIKDMIDYGRPSKEQKAELVAKLQTAKAELDSMSDKAKGKKLDTQLATRRAKEDRAEDVKGDFEAKYYQLQEAKAAYEADKSEANKQKVEDLRKELGILSTMLKEEYFKGQGKDAFSNFSAGIRSKYESRKAKEATGQDQQGQDKKGQDQQGQEKQGQDQPGQKEPGKADKGEPKKKISPEAQAKIDKFAKDFEKPISDYLSVTMNDVKGAIDFYLKGSLGEITTPSGRDSDLARRAKMLESRKFKANIAKQIIKDAFSKILDQAETELTPTEMEALKGQLFQKLQDALNKEYSELFGKNKKSVNGKTVEDLKEDKGKIEKEKEYYETNPSAKELKNRQEILGRIEQAAAILQGIEDGRTDLLDAKTNLLRELNRTDRTRSSFRSTIEEPKKKSEEESKDKPKDEPKTAKDPLQQRFEEVKGTLFNPAVAMSINESNYKYATGKDGKPILIVHVENDGTRVAGGKVNKTIATVVVTEDSIRKISEYVSTTDVESYYLEASGQAKTPEKFSEEVQKYLGTEGLDMRPTNADGSINEKAKPEEVPMLSESLVTTKTGMQQLVVNTPKGISAIAVGAKTKPLTYEQKQEIELFTEQQKTEALGIKDVLINKYGDNLGLKVQDGLETEGANVSMQEQESNLKDFFKILKTDPGNLSVGGTGNFKRDSSKENIVKQNFMTFVFDKYDEANTAATPNKDPQPLQFTLTEREGNPPKNKTTVYVLGADGKYYDMDTIAKVHSMEEIQGKGVDARVILNKAGTLGIGDKFVTNVMKRDTAKALAERAEDKKIEEAGLSQYRVDVDKTNRHVNRSELSLHKQAKFEAEQAREAAKKAKEEADKGKDGSAQGQDDKEAAGRE